MIYLLPTTATTLILSLSLSLSLSVSAVMVSRLLRRSQLAGVTLSVLLTTHHHPSSSSSSSSSSSTVPFSTTTTTKENVHPFSFNKEKLPENVVHLKCKSSAQPGFCDVYLVGTNHFSQRSCAEVQTVINSLKPEVVFLELCGQRQAMLLKTEHLVEPTTEDIIALIRKTDTDILGILISLIYTRIARELKIIPGSEFRVAYEEAMKYGGKVVLGDRPIEITLTRAWRKMPLSEKIGLFSFRSKKDGSSSTEDRLPSRKDCSSLTEFLHKVVEMSDEMNMDWVTLVMQELGKSSPTLLETLIHERDLFMSYALFQEAKNSSCVVAVVGKAHLEGIKKHWQQPVSVINLLTVPPPKDTAKDTAKILTSVGVVVVGVVMLRKYLRFKT